MMGTHVRFRSDKRFCSRLSNKDEERYFCHVLVKSATNRHGNEVQRKHPKDLLNVRRAPQSLFTYVVSRNYLRNRLRRRTLRIPGINSIPCEGEGGEESERPKWSRERGARLRRVKPKRVGAVFVNYQQALSVIFAQLVDIHCYTRKEQRKWLAMQRRPLTRAKNHEQFPHSLVIGWKTV
jgi:hypothetical protein